MMYLAICRDNHDPARAGRIRFECPEILGEGEENWSGWAMPVLPPHYSGVPYEGELVFVGFRENNPTWPVWFGRSLFYNGDFGSEEFRAWSEGYYKNELPDKTEHAINVYDDLDHKKDQEHQHPPYYDPYVSLFKLWNGASLSFNEEPGENETALMDRLGQGVLFRGDVKSPKIPGKETKRRGLKGQFPGMFPGWKADDLDPNSKTKKDTGYVVQAMLAGLHKLFLDLRVKEKDGEEEMELMAQDVAKKHTNNLLFTNIDRLIRLTRDFKGKFFKVILKVDDSEQYYTVEDDKGNKFQINTQSQFIKVIDKKGQHVTIDTAQNAITLQDVNGNMIKTHPSGIQITSIGTTNINSSGPINLIAPVVNVI